MQAARQAIRQRLEAGWPHSDVPILWANEGGQVPDPPVPYLFVEIIGEDEEIKAFGGGRGANEWDWIARIHAHVLVPRTTGTQKAVELAEAFAAVFRGQRFSNVSCWKAAMLDHGAWADDGNWWRQTQTVDFTYRFTG